MLGKNRGKTHPNRRKPVHKPKQTTREKEEKFPAARNHDKSLSDLPRQVGSNLSSIAWPDSVDVSTMAVIMDCKSQASIPYPNNKTQFPITPSPTHT